MARGSLSNCCRMHSYWAECKESVIWKGADSGIVLDYIATGQSVRRV
jgi:hypothetical protein